MGGHEHEETSSDLALDHGRGCPPEREERGPDGRDRFLPVGPGHVHDVGADREIDADDGQIGGVARLVAGCRQALSHACGEAVGQALDREAHQYLPTTKPPSMRRNSPVT